MPREWFSKYQPHEAGNSILFSLSPQGLGTASTQCVCTYKPHGERNGGGSRSAGHPLAGLNTVPPFPQDMAMYPSEFLMGLGVLPVCLSGYHIMPGTRGGQKRLADHFSSLPASLSFLISFCLYVFVSVFSFYLFCMCVSCACKAYGFKYVWAYMYACEDLSLIPFSTRFIVAQSLRGSQSLPICLVFAQQLAWGTPFLGLQSAGVQVLCLPSLSCLVLSILAQNIKSLPTEAFGRFPYWGAGTGSLVNQNSLELPMEPKRTLNS